MMAGEPEGCGPKLTSLATCAKARFPSKPPLVAGGGASSDVCGGTVATALMNGAEATVVEAASAPPSALLRHPHREIAKMHAQSEPHSFELRLLEWRCT